MIVNDVKFNLVIELGQQNLAARDRMTISKQINIAHDKAEFVVPGVVPYKRMATRHVQGQPDAYFYFCGVLDKLGDNKGPVYAKLVQFANTFIPSLQQRPVQLRAELENLEHIRSCSEEMLKPITNGGLGFKPEFVSQIVCQRLQMAMFGIEDVQQADVVQQRPIQNQKEIVITIEQPKRLAVRQGQYQPCCMFDFGEQRSEVTLEPQGQDTYKTTGRAASPTIIDKQHTGTAFSFVRGDGDSVKVETDVVKKTYTMPDGQSTTNLPERFRQFLQFQVQQIGGQWKGFDKNTPLAQLTSAMQFLVGLQFGQINVGTWNPFTLAAKKYFALQTEGGTDQFFWKDGTQPQGLQPQATREDMLIEAFGGVAIAINPTFTVANNKQDIINLAKQFELGLLAYYAMNMEILSRVDFDGNDRQNCQMKQIYRFEGLEALEPMGIVKEDVDILSENMTLGKGTYTTNAQGVPANSKKSVLVSSSATMFATSVDKPAMFPPPIKVITRYDNVHHARVFGTHLFNVDCTNAQRHVPQCVQKLKDDTYLNEYYKYEMGCPFFQDRQREFLLMSVGLEAQIDSVLVFAPHKNNCWILNKNGDVTLQQKIQAIKPNNDEYKQMKFQMQFCNGDDIVGCANTKYGAENSKQIKDFQKQLVSIVRKFGFCNVQKIK